MLHPTTRPGTLARACFFHSRPRAARISTPTSHTSLRCKSRVWVPRQSTGGSCLSFFSSTFAPTLPTLISPSPHDPRRHHRPHLNSTVLTQLAATARTMQSIKKHTAPANARAVRDTISFFPRASPIGRPNQRAKLSAAAAEATNPRSREVPSRRVRARCTRSSCRARPARSARCSPSAK
jgi:hypothetical protein